MPKKIELSDFFLYFSQATSKNRVNIFIPVTFSAFSEKRMAHKKEGTLRFFARPNEFDRGTHRARLFVSNRVGRGPSYRFCVELIPVFPFCVHRVSFGLFAFGNHCTEPYSKVKCDSYCVPPSHKATEDRAASAAARPRLDGCAAALLRDAYCVIRE